MRRADRLFQIVQLLRSDKVITAASLAEALAVSERTIYRDIQDLSLSGVPVTGEAGVGYRLLEGYHLPPLMFNQSELEALLLGARMVKAWSDPVLAKATDAAISKIEAVVPNAMQPEFEREHLRVPDFRFGNRSAHLFGQLRSAIAQTQKILVRYRRVDGEVSERTIRPLGLFFWGPGWTMLGWCELRDDFRNFRVDRMIQLEVLSETFEVQQGKSLRDYLAMTCHNPGK